jgi:hypothetical protein
MKKAAVITVYGKTLLIERIDKVRNEKWAWKCILEKWVTSGLMYNYVKLKHWAILNKYNIGKK